MSILTLFAFCENKLCLHKNFRSWLKLNVSVFITLFHDGLSKSPTIQHKPTWILGHDLSSFLVESTSVLQNRVEGRNQLPRQ